MKTKLNKYRRQLLLWTAPTVAAVTMPVHAMTSPMLSIEKVQTGGPNPATADGDVLEYTVTVMNTGSVAITGVVVTDTMPDGNEVVLSSPVESVTSDSILEVGETWTFATSYTVTLADLLDGVDLTNVASVSADNILGSMSDSEVVPVTQVFECSGPPIVSVPVAPKCAGNPPIGTAQLEVFAPDTAAMELIDIQVTSTDPASTLTLPSLPANLSDLVALALTWDGPASDALTCLPLAQIDITLEYACSDGVSLFEDYDVTALLIASVP